MRTGHTQPSKKGEYTRWRVLQQLGNPVNIDSGLNYFPLKEVLIASDIRVMEASGELEVDMQSFFDSDKHDILIVPIDESIRMSANPAI